jgi:hypothetical protein
MLEGVLSDLGIEADFEYVKCTGQGLGESSPDEYYVCAVAELRGQLVEVFVYSDEIGFSSEGSWRIFERQDFAEESKMIDTALRELRLFIVTPRRSPSC